MSSKELARLVTRLQNDSDTIMIGSVSKTGKLYLKPNTVYGIIEENGELKLKEKGQGCGAGVNNCASREPGNNGTAFNWNWDITDLISNFGNKIFKTMAEYSRDFIAVKKPPAAEPLVEKPVLPKPHRVIPIKVYKEPAVKKVKEVPATEVQKKSIAFVPVYSEQNKPIFAKFVKPWEVDVEGVTVQTSALKFNTAIRLREVSAEPTLYSRELISQHDTLESSVDFDKIFYRSYGIVQVHDIARLPGRQDLGGTLGSGTKTVELVIDGSLFEFTLEYRSSSTTVRTTYRKSKGNSLTEILGFTVKATRGKPVKIIDKD